jgi:hypothetical protein
MEKNETKGYIIVTIIKSTIGKSNTLKTNLEFVPFVSIPIIDISWDFNKRTTSKRMEFLFRLFDSLGSSTKMHSIAGIVRINLFEPKALPSYYFKQLKNRALEKKILLRFLFKESKRFGN